MSTLLEKRQQAAIRDLLKRKAAAEAYIEHHTQKLQEKVQPYKNELVIIDSMLSEQEPKQQFEGDGHTGCIHAE